MATRLLMEGILDDENSVSAEGCIMYPSVAYVRQPIYKGVNESREKIGERVYFLDGKPDQLNESIEEGVTVVENYEDLDLVERTLADGTKTKLPKGSIFVEGVYQRSDTKNANRRTYGRKIWERIVKDVNSPAQKAVTERRMIGHLEHPADGRTDGKEGAMLNTSMKLLENGDVWGRSELLDTPNGHILQEYTRKKVKWGVSSRGQGSVDAGGAVNEKDYNLTTFDAVMNPSTPGAYPKKTGKVDDNTSESTGSDDSAENKQDDSADLAVMESEISELRELDLNGLDESERANAISRLVVQMGVVSGLEKSQTLEKSRADELGDWLKTRLSEAIKQAEPDFDAALDEALNQDTTETSGTTLDDVLGNMQERISDALDEAEAERENARVAAEDLKESQQELEEVRQLLAESTKALESEELRASLLELLVAEATEKEQAEGVEEAVSEVIKELPRLEKYRDALENSDTAEEVHNLAERLVEDVVEDLREEAAATKTSFVPPISPAGLQIVSESDVSKRSRGSNPSRGAQLAGQVLASAKS